MPLRDRLPLINDTPEHHLKRTLSKIGVLVGIVFVVLLIGAAVYQQIEHIPYIEALYSVVMLMTAIGSSRDPQTMSGKVFNIVLALVSVALLISIVTQIGQLLLRREFLSVLNAWRHKKMKDHTIICGVSHTSHELLNRLPVDKVVVLVKTHDDAHRIQREHEHMHVHVCDYTSSLALQHAGIDTAELLIASSDSDADNAFTCLTAKHLRPGIRVITRMSRTENREKMQGVGSDAIISPAELAADAVMEKIREFEAKKT